VIVIDALRLMEDLKESYFTRFRDVAMGAATGPNGETSASMQAQLDDVERYNGNSVSEHAPALAALPQTANIVVGASGGLGPIPDEAPISVGLGQPAVPFSPTIFGNTKV
jgi:hypothetical protein